MIALGLTSLGAVSGRAAIAVAPTGSATTLVNTLLGSGITLVPGSASLVGGGLGTASSSAATFTGGLSTGIGIDNGVLLSTGFAASVTNTNTMGGVTGAFGTPGDVGLTMASGVPTFDATVLSFNFTSTTGSLYFRFAFGSEEYNEFANTAFNDVFAFFVDGTNIALLPGTNTPISINTVNGGNNSGLGDPTPQNPQFYNNNELVGGTSAFNFEYDGFTSVFMVSAQGLAPGQHNVRLAIADGADVNVDSGVFFEAGSFTSGSGPGPTGVPAGDSILSLVVLGAMAVAGLKRFGGRRRAA